MKVFTWISIIFTPFLSFVYKCVFIQYVNIYIASICWISQSQLVYQQLVNFKSFLYQLILALIA